jgi:hypothetical protein
MISPQPGHTRTRDSCTHEVTSIFCPCTHHLAPVIQHACSKNTHNTRHPPSCCLFTLDGQQEAQNAARTRTILYIYIYILYPGHGYGTVIRYPEPVIPHRRPTRRGTTLPHAPDRFLPFFFSRSVTHVQLGAVVSFSSPESLAFRRRPHSPQVFPIRHRTRVPLAFDPVEPALFDPDPSPPFPNLRQLAPWSFAAQVLHSHIPFYRCHPVNTTAQIGGTNARLLHYRNRALCRAPTAHGKERKTHGTAFAVRILPKRTTKGARSIFTR